MAKRLSELGALQDAISNNEAAPSRLGLAGYIRGLFLDWSANPYNPLSRLTARGRLLGYFWDSGAIGLSMNFADQNYLVKDGTVKSKSFSDIVNFTRTTNATVTNSAGVITYAPHNLALASEQLDSASWNKGASTITANSTTAPNGTVTADTLTATAAYGNVASTTPVATIATVHTVSWYVKKNTYDRVELGIANTSAFGNGALVLFNLTTGVFVSSRVFGTGYSVASYSIQPDSNEFYRITATINTPVGSHAATIGLSVNAVAGSSIYAWGAQLEIGSTATTYNSTTVKNLLGFSELFDNAAWTKSNSFVQTNLLTYSEAFDNAAWVKTNNVLVTANGITAPNATTTADKLIATTTSGQHYLTLSGGVSTGTNIVTFSFYVKAAEYNYVAFYVADGNVGRAFDLTNGTLLGTIGGNSPTNSTITSVGSGWYRCTITWTPSSGSPNPRIYNTTDGSTTTFSGDNTSGVYIWGAQLVQGSVAGDYRRTDAAALPVYYPNHNGVVCAEQLHGTAANGTILESYTATGGSMTFSLWMRRITGTGNVDITMDTGVTWTTQAITTSWARYSITTTPTSGARTAGVRLVTSGDVIQVFGGMVSDSASLDPYVLNAAAAPTAAAYYGARFDYDPVTLAPKGLLIEEQRSNLALYSTDFTLWNNSNVTITSNFANSPDGNQTATRVVSTVSDYIFRAITVSAGVYTFSFYAKNNGGTAASYAIYNDTVPGFIVSQTSFLSSINSSTWTRITVTFTVPAGTTLIRVYPVADSGGANYLIWGAQLEAGAFATSYIPTAASQVTRAADVATIQGSNFYGFYNQNEGSVVVNADETSTAASGNRKTLYTFTAGNFNNIIRNGIDSGTVASFNATYESAAQASLSISASYQANVFSKSSSAYKVNDFYLNVNNGTATVDTSGTTPMSFFMDIGYGPQVSSGTGNTAGDFLNGHIKQISYYPQRLSSDVLKGLTA